MFAVCLTGLKNGISLPFIVRLAAEQMQRGWKRVKNMLRDRFGYQTWIFHEMSKLIYGKG